MQIGEITSGVFGPSVKVSCARFPLLALVLTFLLSPQGPVAMGYVDKKFSKVGTALQVDKTETTSAYTQTREWERLGACVCDAQVEIRGKMRPITVSKMPFTTPNYFRG